MVGINPPVAEQDNAVIVFYSVNGVLANAVEGSFQRAFFAVGAKRNVDGLSGKMPGVDAPDFL